MIQACGPTLTVTKLCCVWPRSARDAQKGPRKANWTPELERAGTKSELLGENRPEKQAGDPNAMRQLDYSGVMQIKYDGVVVISDTKNLPAQDTPVVVFRDEETVQNMD